MAAKAGMADSEEAVVMPLGSVDRGPQKLKLADSETAAVVARLAPLGTVDRWPQKLEVVALCEMVESGEVAVVV